jgi:(p)ppGpp synthase/HD superfamily hydrolase
MVANVAEDFKHLLDDKVDYYTGKVETYKGGDITVSLQEACLIAAWGHDLIEDTRVSYNDVKSNLGQEAADIIYAVTNEKGKDRKERANEKYYEGIRNTPGAVFVKLCDRIANVQYSKMTKSRMFEMYKKENAEFTKALGLKGDGVEYPGHEYYKMYKYLINLFA